MNISNFSPATYSRDWTDIWKSLLATHIAGFYSYVQLGLTTHRQLVKQDRQWIILPVFFVLFSFLYPCQIMMAIPLAIRNRLWRPRQDLTYYICGILGMCAKRTAFEDKLGNYDDSAKKRVPGLLLDYFPPRVQPKTERWSQKRFLEIGMTIFASNQAISTAIIYIRRCSRQESNVLGIDHRLGAMAFGAAITSLACLFFQVTGLDWEDKLCDDKLVAKPTFKLENWEKYGLSKTPGDSEYKRKLNGSLDVTNKHVYDCILTICIHAIHLYLNGRYLPFFDSGHRSLRISSGSIVSLFVACGLINLPIWWDAFWHQEAGAATFYRAVPRGDKLIRAIVIFTGEYMAAVVLMSEVTEIQDLARGITNSTNLYWTWEDPWTKYLWSF